MTNEVEKLTEIIAKFDALRERAEKAEANMARLATAGNVLALRLKHIVGKEDIIRRWENLHAALRHDEEDEAGSTRVYVDGRPEGPSD